MTKDVKSLSKVLADNLRFHRKRLGLTQEQLAEAAGFSVQAVQTAESEKRWPGLDTLEAFARVLGIPQASLFNTPVPPTPQQALEVLRQALEGPPLTSLQREVLTVIGGLDDAKARQWLSAIRLDQSTDLADSEDLNRPKQSSKRR